MRPTTSQSWYKSLTSEELRTMAAATARRLLPWGDRSQPLTSEELKMMVAAITVLLLRWGIRDVPVGVRSVFGVLLMVAGVFGFLPIIGFWLFPIGVAFVALDVPWTRQHIHDWMERLEKRIEQAG